MEALLIIFAEIIFACLAPLISLAGALIGALFEAVAVLFGLAVGSSAGKRKNDAPPRKTGKVSRYRRPALWAGGIITGLGVVGVLVSVLFFEAILGRILDRAAEQAGMRLVYEEASGSFLSGHVALRGLVVERASDDGLAFEIAVDLIEADVALLSLIGGEPRLELARVEGASGFVTPAPAREKTIKPKKRRPFRADRVLARDVAIELRPRDRDPYDLVIESAEVVPFRSSLAVFDLLFRSNLSAEIAGQRLAVSTRQISESGRETAWNFDQVEADRLKLVVPRAPLTWLNGGTLTARVEDRWDLADEGIDMDWLIAVEDIDVAPPSGAGAGERLLASGLSKAVAAQGGDAEFRYVLSLSGDEVQAMREGDLEAFWDVVLSGLVKDGVEDAAAPTSDGDDPEPGAARRAVDKIRSLLKAPDDD